jgi:hypothetical protein
VIALDVGRALASVVRLTSWAEGLSVFDDDATRVAGVLLAPASELDRVRARAPQRLEWLQGIWALISRGVELVPPAIPDRDAMFELVLTDYIHDFAKSVATEVLYDDLTTSTYFREQLQWFCAGYFPCGWEGSWPGGAMRVF